MDTTIPNPDSTEPVLSVGTITAVVTALIVLVVSFGVPLSDDQQSAILGVLAAAAPFIAAVVARRSAYSPATVARLLRSK